MKFPSRWAASAAFVLLLGAWGVPRPSAAQEEGPPGRSPAEDRFRKFDRNGDGALTSEEVGNAELFRRLDRDGNGRVTREEALAAVSAAGGAAPHPTFENVSYGPHARNVLDFWKAASGAPAPVVVFIHGGGFVGGDKSQARRSSYPAACLSAGVSFAAINYRFLAHAPVQDILRDAARAIQFIRHKASEWNVDKRRIAAYGGSAGAGTSLWLASHDDLADPSSGDPVLRESSRLAAAGCQATQATYDLSRWEAFLGPFKQEWLNGPNEIAEFYHFKVKADLETPEGKRVLADCDMLALLTKDDPPVYVFNNQPDGPPRDRGHMLHHPNHAREVKKRCDEAGVECVMAAPAGGPGRPEKILDFLFRCLKVRPPAGGAKPAPGEGDR